MAIQQPLPAPHFQHPQPQGPQAQAPQPQPAPAPHDQPPHQTQPKPAGNLTPAQSEALKIHNEARQEVSKSTGVHRPDLIWDSKLVAAAEQWANYLVNRNAGLQHSSNDQRPNQGENLYWQSSGGTLANASQAWVNEKKSYHGEKIGEGNFEAYGHYTQVIWPSTTHVGVAVATTKDGAEFIVGRYSPPGNYTGQSAYTGH